MFRGVIVYLYISKKCVTVISTDVCFLCKCCKCVIKLSNKYLIVFLPLQVSQQQQDNATQQCRQPFWFAMHLYQSCDTYSSQAISLFLCFIFNPWLLMSNLMLY